jgi:hypothetical protein
VEQAIEPLSRFTLPIRREHQPGESSNRDDAASRKDAAQGLAEVTARIEAGVTPNVECQWPLVFPAVAVARVGADGASLRLLQVSFATPPTAHVVRGRWHISFDSTFKEIAYPVFAEAYVTRLLDRDEFRAHCDRYKTREQILQHL